MRMNLSSAIGVYNKYRPMVNYEVVMLFDNDLKEGVCQKTNAQVILKVLAPKLFTQVK